MSYHLPLSLFNPVSRGFDLELGKREGRGDSVSFMPNICTITSILNIPLDISEYYWL